MQREAKAYLWDIANAAQSIRTFVSNKDLSDYLSDELLRSAVERKFGIIGEALSGLLRFFPVWEIVQTYLPQLQSEVSQLLNEP